jgi:hypothetical protein
MYSKKVCIELDKPDTVVHWENLSDVHVGNSNFQEALYKRRIKAIVNDPYRFTSFGGDQWDLILPGDPRFKDEAVRGRTLADQQDEFERLTEPLFNEHKRFQSRYGMDKIWYMQWGNHEYKSRVVTEGDMKRYCRFMNMDFLGSKGFVRLDIRYKNRSKMKKTLFVNHGAGGGSAYTALQKLTDGIEADVYQMGHLHEPQGHKTDTFFFNDKTGKWDTKEQILVNSGCFTTAVQDGVDQWMEQKGNKLKVSKPGTWTISFDAYNGKATQHG